MRSRSIALAQLQHLLGANATDDRTWSDLRRFEAAALPAVNELWELDRIADGSFWHVIHPRDEAAGLLYAGRVEEAVRQVQAALGDDTASRCAAAFFLSPQLWQPAYFQRHYQFYNYRGQAEVQLLAHVAEACVKRRMPADWTARLAQRMLTICLAATVNDQPSLSACVGYLLAGDDRSTWTLLDGLTLGDWDLAWKSLLELARQTHPPAVERLRAHWQGQGAGQIIELLRRLHRQGRLDAPNFRRALEALPESLRVVNAMFSNQAGKQLPADQVAFMGAAWRLTDAVLWEMLCDFRPETWPTLSHVSYLGGGRYLLRLLEETERQGLTPNRSGGPVGAVLSRLFGVLKRRDDDDSAALVPLLRQIGVPTLLLALPQARPYEAELCAALDWPGSHALVALLHRLEEHCPARSTDPTAGVVRRQEVLDVVATMDEQHVRTLIESFASYCPSAVLMVQAVLGWNRKEVRRMLGRRNQLAARALPLLPMDGPDEVLQRYLLLAKYQREANSSGAGRKAYERAAAQAGMASLALHAGYADVTRLEWVMEDRLGAETIALGRQWEIEGYTLTLVLNDHGPAIAVRSPKRLLKRTPSAVTRDYAYREVRTVLEQAQDQERRYRQAFLNAMRAGQPLSGDELALLRRNPLATALLERLVLIDEAGAIGLFRAEDCSLEGVHGERVLISGAVTIAHPYTLAQAGLLSDWQAEIVRRQLVQPFKQIFRELYLLTPAEREAIHASARLAGRRLKGRQAIAVLANLGWEVDSYGTVRKSFYDLGFAAHFESGSYRDYYDDADDGATTGVLTFWPLKYEHAGYGCERRIPLADIPPLIFSEVLRDLDTVTVIAHQSEERGTSKEVLLQRGDLVRATAAAMGLAQVRVEEPHVHVRGELTSYRIHLATGAIYLESGQYLCIVPSPKQRKAIYLPFAEGGEPITSEIISKVLLLANDKRITDGTILAQIAPVQQAA